MTPIEDYIQLPQADRQAHLKLDEPCTERGGMSSYCKGLMAHLLDTTIPSGKKIHVCHACHNGLCSNPNHLYWGTPSENRLDFVNSGQIPVRKASGDKMKRMGNQNAKGLKGTTKSEEHKKKIAEAIRRKYKERVG
jgi:hypothetical protein